MMPLALIIIIVVVVVVVVIINVYTKCELYFFLLWSYSKKLAEEVLCF